MPKAWIDGHALCRVQIPSSSAAERLARILLYVERLASGEHRDIEEIIREGGCISEKVMNGQTRAQPHHAQDFKRKLGPCFVVHFMKIVTGMRCPDSRLCQAAEDVHEECIPGAALLLKDKSCHDEGPDNILVSPRSGQDTR